MRRTLSKFGLPFEKAKNYSSFNFLAENLEKLSIPLEPHHKAQSSEIFLSFQPKIIRAVIFYLLPNPAETPYLSVRDGKLFNAVRLVEFRPSCSSHLFGVVSSRAAQTAFAPELSKAITFCLRSYPGEISHSNLPNRELSNDLWDVVVR